MSVREEVYNFLSTVSALTAYIDDRLYWIDSQTLTYPQIVFKEFSTPTSYQTDDQWQRWRFYFLAETQFDCQSMRDTVRTNLNRSYGLFGTETIDFIAHVNDQEMLRREDGVFELISDYRVSYH